MLNPTRVGSNTLGKLGIAGRKSTPAGSGLRVKILRQKRIDKVSLGEEQQVN